MAKEPKPKTEADVAKELLSGNAQKEQQPASIEERVAALEAYIAANAKMLGWPALGE